MPFVEGGIVVDAEPQQQAAPPMAQGGFVQGGIEVDPTPEDSYNKVLQYKAAQTDYTPTKQEFLDYLKVGKEKSIDLKGVAAAFGPGLAHIAALPYRLGEAIGDIYQPPEGATEGDVAAATFAETAIQSRQKAQSLFRGISTSIIDKLDQLPQLLRSKEDRARVESMLDDIKYADFLEKSDIDRQLALANAPQEQRVPASREVLRTFNIPEEALSQPGLEVGGFLADPSSIAFAGGGKLASVMAQQAVAQIPRAAEMLRGAGERVSQIGRIPENLAGRFTTKVTGSEQIGQAVQEGISKGTTSIAVGEAAGIPITMNVPMLGTASRVIGGTKGLGATMETVGEAGAASRGPALTPTQRGLLGTGERIAAAEGASSKARALGTVIARSGLETPVKMAASILVPMTGAAAGGGLLAAMSGEEADAISAAIGSGAAFGVFDGGFRLGKAVEANVFNGRRVRQTAVDDLNTRPTEVQFTYIDPVAGEQTATIKDSEARATLYGRLNNKQLTKALSEVAAAEGAGVDVIFHSDADTVPAGLQTVNYAGAAIGPKDIKSGKPTILINVDKAIPETIPHEILHARITQDMVSQLGSKIVEATTRSPQKPTEATEFEKQFTKFADLYAQKIQDSGGAVLADRIRTELRDAFDPTLQRAQRIESLKRMTDEFAAYYTQEMLKGKDPKTMLPGRIPSFFEMALNNAMEAVSERFTRRALQAGFDPVARTFYDANGRRIKLDWMEDAIKNLVTPKEGYEPTEQKVDINKLTQAQQNAVIMARGYSDLFMTGPDGSIIRPLSKAEIAAKTADVANRTMQVIETVPQNERGSVSGLDAKGNPIIEGRLSLAEADAVSKSGIFSPSTSRSLIDIATAIRDGTLMEGKYWKVYGSTGKSGVFGESEKLFLPYGISINSKGGVNIKAVDWGKVQARMYKALTKPAYKNLFGNYDQAMSTLKDVYLKNIAEQNAAPSAEALGGGIEGAKKRNFFNEVMGAVPKKGDTMINLPTAGYEASRKGGSVYQDLRIERIQNTNTTGTEIPWSGDMGEQSSYRRTQLNFQPAEQVGETRVQSDLVGGYRILSKGGKFRLYGPDGSTAGIFDTEGQAKLKAEKDYATQARLQPEVRQQQRPQGDEVRQTAEAGRGDSAVGRQEGQAEGGAVRQAGDVRFMPDGKSAGLAVLDNELALNLPKRPKVLDIANAFQDLFGKAIEYRKSSLQENARLANALVQEIQRAVELHPEAKGWYDENIKLTMDVMRDLDPDLAKPENDFMFKVILAATSDGNKVGPQFQQTWKEYSNWKNTGKISGDFVSGDRIENIKGNLKMFNEMVNTIGWEKTKDFFTRKGTVKEVRQALMDTFGWTKKEAQGVGSSELADEVVPFAVVLGPKLGSFFNNLYGDFSSVTMDRWFMRTIGRLTGTQVEPLAGSKVREMRNNLRDAVARLTPSEFEMLGVKRGDLKGTSIDGAATTISGRFAKKSLRDTAKQSAESGQSALEETRKFANALKKGLNPLVEAPVDGTHRRWIRERIAEVQKDLRSRGIELENADLQAVLWYLEKELYEKLNYRSKSGESDYASAASSLYQDVVGRPSDVYARGTGRVRAIGGDGRGNVVDAANGGQAPRQEVGAQRYMPSDTDYLSAVQQGDTQAAQRMVDEAAKAAGAINAGKPLYHGGNRTKTSFAAGATRSGMGLAYLTDNKRAAWKYALGGGINDEMSLADYRRQQLKKLPSREPTVQKLYVVGDVADFSSYQDRPSASQLIEMFGEGKMSNILEDYSSRYREELYRGDSVESTLQGALEEGGFVQEDTNATAGVPELQFLAASGLLDSYLKKIGKNVVAYNDAEAGGKTYVVFDPTQLKSADPITRDDAGNVIPLSKRFQQTSEDIRYMPSDDEYLNAVKRGNTQATQDMVDAAAKAAGYTTKVFHGSVSQFNRPNTPLFLGDEGTAMSYAQDRAMAYGEGANPVTYKIYAKFKNPASETDVKEAAMDLGLEVENDMAYTALDPQISGSRYVSRVISELKKRGYDSANIDDFSPDSAQNVIKSFVAFDPSQLKRSDPITYDDAGNVIPLSQRFKATSEDIRYMPAGDMASGRSVKDHREAMDLFEKGYRLYGALYDGMEDPVRLKKATEIERFDPENLWAVPPRRVAAAIAIRNMPAGEQDTKALQMLPKPRRSLDAAYQDGVKTRSQDPQYYDVPDYVGYDMARTAAFEMGREGAEPPRWVMAERIGKLPTEGRSKNFAEDRMERGVSVLRIVGEPQADVGTYEMFNPGEKRYVAGWLVGLGSDGEPLLADAVDLGLASSDVRMMPQPDSAMPGAYSFQGGYRAIPGKTKGSFRLYGPAGSLIGIASSLDEAQRILRRKAKQ